MTTKGLPNHLTYIEDVEYGVVSARLVKVQSNNYVYSFASDGEEFDYVVLSFRPKEKTLKNLLEQSVVNSRDFGGFG